jgi:regulation of enolase protein 1 (concanavalin A-like superfamily)
MNWLETPVTGNMSMSVHITPIAQAAGTGTLMIRSSLLAASSFLSFGISPSNNLTLQYRVAAEGSAQTFALPAPSGTSWIRLTKIRNAILPEYSTDGIAWTSAHAITITFPTGQYFMGLGNLSEQGLPTTATFDHFLVEAKAIGKWQRGR